MEQKGGYEKIYRDLVDSLKSINLDRIATSLDLSCHPSGHVEIPFLGSIYLLGPKGVQRKDNQEVATAHGSVLAGYLIKKGSGDPAGKFVSLDSLTGLVPARRSYGENKLESRIS